MTGLSLLTLLSDRTFPIPDFSDPVQEYPTHVLVAQYQV